MVSLRQAISTSDLSEILTNRDKISKVVANTISQNAKRWGITVDNVEIKDIRIPDNLQDAMSQKAQASKEREARIIFADSEYQVAKKFKEAAKEYANSPEALQLRGMNMMYEGLKTGNSTIVIVPSSAVENMGFGGIMGTVQAKGLVKKKE
jgi:regulator of protease activity HflC (stomatin/prohibitin superfamily)